MLVRAAAPLHNGHRARPDLLLELRRPVQYLPHPLLRCVRGRLLRGARASEACPDSDFFFWLCLCCLPKVCVLRTRIAYVLPTVQNIRNIR